MSSQHLRKFFEDMPPRTRNLWCLEQLEKARKALRRAYAKSNRSNRDLIARDADVEIFGETVARISVGRKGYVWSGEGDFNVFFAACMARTVHYMHSRTRPDRQRLIPMSNEDLILAASRHPVEPTQLQDVGRAQYPKTKDAVLANPHLPPDGAVAKFIKNLEKIVENEMSPIEICEEIGISLNSLGSTRVRVRRQFGDPEKD